MQDKKHYSYKDMLKLSKGLLTISVEEKIIKKKVIFLLDDDLCAFFDIYKLNNRFINDCIKAYLDMSHIDWRSYNNKGVSR